MVLFMALGELACQMKSVTGRKRSVVIALPGKYRSRSCISVRLLTSAPFVVVEVLFPPKHPVILG